MGIQHHQGWGPFGLELLWGRRGRMNTHMWTTLEEPFVAVRVSAGAPSPTQPDRRLENCQPWSVALAWISTQIIIKSSVAQQCQCKIKQKPIQGSEIQAIGTNDPCYANGLLIESAEMLNGDTSGRLQASQWKPFLKSSTCWQKAQYQFNPASLDTLKSV